MVVDSKPYTLHPKLSGSDQGTSTWALRVHRQTSRWFIGMVSPPIHPTFGSAMNLRCDGFILGNHGSAYKVHADAVLDHRIMSRPLNENELAALHRTPVTKECGGGRASFGTDSIIVMTLDRGKGEARVSVVKGVLLQVQRGHWILDTRH